MKYNFVLEYLGETRSVSVLDSYFVEEYVERFKPKNIKFQVVGADIVPELGRLLTRMYNENLLYRDIHGLQGMESGFPKWIYSYRKRYHGIIE